jgi:hypothetical protein
MPVVAPSRDAAVPRGGGWLLGRCLRCGVSTSSSRTSLAGTPATIVLGATSRLTTAPAATTDPSPMKTPGSTVTREAIQTPSPMMMGATISGPQRAVDGPISWSTVSKRT